MEPDRRSLVGGFEDARQTRVSGDRTRWNKRDAVVMLGSDRAEWCAVADSRYQRRIWDGVLKRGGRRGRHVVESTVSKSVAAVRRLA